MLAIILFYFLHELLLHVHVSGLQYIGCYNDQQPTRDLPFGPSTSATNTPTECMIYCNANGYKYAGGQYGDQCRCGNSYGDHGNVLKDDADCNMPCDGDTSLMCGAGWHNSIYTLLPMVPKLELDVDVSGLTSINDLIMGFVEYGLAVCTHVPTLNVRRGSSTEVSLCTVEKVGNACVFRCSRSPCFTADLTAVTSMQVHYRQADGALILLRSEFCADINSCP